jgi:hypothetical protein
VTFLINELVGRRLDLILNIAPKATIVGYLVAKQTNRQAEEETGKLLQAAQTMERQIIVLECRDVSDFEKAFATVIEPQVDAAPFHLDSTIAAKS